MIALKLLGNTLEDDLAGSRNAVVLEARRHAL